MLENFDLQLIQNREGTSKKGYEAVLLQEVVIKTDNVRFLKEKWYSQ